MTRFWHHSLRGHDKVCLPYLQLYFVSDHPWFSQVSARSYCLSQKQKTLNIMILKCVNNLSTPEVDLRAEIVAEHAQTVKYNQSTVTISARYPAS